MLRIRGRHFRDRLGGEAHDRKALLAGVRQFSHGFGDRGADLGPAIAANEPGFKTIVISIASAPVESRVGAARTSTTLLLKRVALATSLAILMILSSASVSMSCP
jgi:hypothetical protein